MRERMKRILREFRSLEFGENSFIFFLENDYNKSRLAALLESYPWDDEIWSPDSLIIVTEVLVEELDEFQNRYNTYDNRLYYQFLNDIRDKIGSKFVKTIQNMKKNATSDSKLVGRKYIDLPTFEKLYSKFKLEEKLQKELNDILQKRRVSLRCYFETKIKALDNDLKGHLSTHSASIYQELTKLEKEYTEYKYSSNNAQTLLYTKKELRYHDTSNMGYDSWVPCEEIETPVYEPDHQTRQKAAKKCVELQACIDAFKKEKAAILSPFIAQMKNLQSQRKQIKGILTTLENSYHWDLSDYTSFIKEVAGCLHDFDQEKFAINNTHWQHYQTTLSLEKPDKDDYLSCLPAEIRQKTALFAYGNTANPAENKTRQEIFDVADITKASNVNNQKSEPSSVQSNKEKILKYIDSQLNRLSDHTTKYWNLLRLKWHIKEEFYSDDEGLQKEITHLRYITKKHNDKGLKGFFKLAWLRDSKSYSQFKDCFEQDHPSVNKKM